MLDRLSIPKRSVRILGSTILASCTVACSAMAQVRPGTVVQPRPGIERTAIGLRATRVETSPIVVKGMAVWPTTRQLRTTPAVVKGLIVKSPIRITTRRILAAGMEPAGRARTSTTAIPLRTAPLRDTTRTGP